MYVLLESVLNLITESEWNLSALNIDCIEYVSPNYQRHRLVSTKLRRDQQLTGNLTCL